MSAGKGISSQAAAQDQRWQEKVREWRSGKAPSFAEQFSTFQEIYADREVADGPPAVWQPGPDSLRSSNLAAFMRAEDKEDYASFHAWTCSARSKFWGRVLDRLGIAFSKPPETILSGEARDPIWLAGAELNISDSCFRGDPDAPAIVSGEEGSAVVTVTSFSSLEKLVNRFANGLLEHGFAPGDGIALYMPMNLECVAAYLGIVRAGCVAISIADSFSPSEVARRNRIAGAKGILTVATMHRAGKSIPLYDKVREAEGPPAIVLGGADNLRDGDWSWEDFLSSRDSFESRKAGPQDATNILFSSGTTGDPKAIPWTHLTPIKAAMDGRYHQDIRAGDVVAWPTNIGWMMGPWLIYASLINRAAMALYDGVPTGQGFTGFVQKAGVTMLGVVPGLVRAWRRNGAADQVSWDSLRAFSSTGEASNVQDYLWLMSRSGYRAPIIEYCGGTEIGGGHLTGTMVQPASPATFSTPALGLDLVLMGEEGQPVKENEMGELFLIPPSIGLSQTLLNRDHDEVYYQDCPPGPRGKTLRRHGDQVQRLARGYFRALGRADDTMNLGGIKVSSLELERIMNADPGVHECAAIGIPPPDGGAERLIVYVVPQGEETPTTLQENLGRRIRENLNPLFKIHAVVPIESLPRTASNKVMRRKLRESYSEGGSL